MVLSMLAAHTAALMGGVKRRASSSSMRGNIPASIAAWMSEEIFLSFNLRILRRHGTGTSISRATAG